MEISHVQSFAKLHPAAIVAGPEWCVLNIEDDFGSGPMHRLHGLASEEGGFVEPYNFRTDLGDDFPQVPVNSRDQGAGWTPELNPITHSCRRPIGLERKGLHILVEALEGVKS